MPAGRFDQAEAGAQDIHVDDFAHGEPVRRAACG
jgi:hypothetical protein